MPRKSKTDLLESRMIEELEAKAFDASLPAYVQAKCMGTLTTLLRRRDKRMAEKSARSASRRAAKPVSYHQVLPRNGREPVDLGAYLDAKAINRG
jgi:hypothetical protein